LPTEDYLQAELAPTAAVKRQRLATDAQTPVSATAKSINITVAFQNSSKLNYRIKPNLLVGSLAAAIASRELIDPNTFVLLGPEGRRLWLHQPLSSYGIAEHDTISCLYHQEGC